MSALFRVVYTILLYFLTPLILLRMAWRARRAPVYLKRWPERFGWSFSVDGPADIWVHAVSLGEVNAIQPLIKALQNAYPAKKILITTMTPTGSKRVKELFGESVVHTYLPFDYPGAIKRFLNFTQPKIAIFAETELWPNTYFACAKRNIPILVVNARLSERSMRGYQRILPLIRAVLAKVTLILAQSAADAARFSALGMVPERVQIAGNIKFDMSLPDDLKAKAQPWLARWGSDRLVWIAASTHPGEESMILTAFKAIKILVPSALLILVPRHTERSTALLTQIKQQDFNVALRTEEHTITPQIDVLLVNTMGELMLWYACAQVSFVGGSLIPHGGHNVLEPAAMGLPILCGPHMFNFAEIYQLLKDADGIITVNSEKELAQHVIELFGNPALRSQKGENAQALLARHRGAVAKQMTAIAPFIN